MLSIIAKRSLFVFCALFLFAVIIVVRLFGYQVLDYEKYQEEVIDQVTVETTEKASRGNIYDTNMNLLAANTTAFRVFISPSDIQTSSVRKYASKLIYRMRYGISEESAGNGKSQEEIIAEGLNRILGVDYDFIIEKARKKNRRDETIKASVDADTAKKVLEFAQENNLGNQIHVSPVTKRYYCYDSLASHVLGFTGSDNQGLYGFEYQYNEELTGTDGRYIKAQDANGRDMPYDYATYYPAVSGLNAVTTLDMTIQYMLQEQLEATYEENGAGNRVAGVVMNVKTGAIYALAVYPSFNLNDPYTLVEYYKAVLAASGYEEGSTEYSKLYNQLLLEMWSNKAVSETYEPGSTFKIVTSSMALEENLVKISDMFYCGGSMTVEGYGRPIHCHKVTGHGSVNFATGLQQSCNVVLMSIAARIGSPLFYSYVRNFGYLDKTGIDLPGEAKSIFLAENRFGPVELAVASFGQRFKVNIMQQLAAVAAVANGGKLVTPHVLEYFTDSDGNIVYSYDTKVVRQVVSEETCKTLTQILEEGVSGDGGAKNAYVRGYKVAAKTGTSEKFDILDAGGNSYLRVGSCVAFAPADDPEIAAIIIVDEPTKGVVYGSQVAAPYISKLLSSVLPYLGIEPSYTEKELAAMEVNVSNYVGLKAQSAAASIKSAGLKYEIVGNGENVTAQIPAAGTSFVKSTGKIILYTDGEVPKNSVNVPDVTGKTASAANAIIINAGLNVRLEGALNYQNGTSAMVVSQSVAANTKVPKGTVVTIVIRHTDGTD